MAYGDVTIDTFTVGSLDLASGSGATMAFLNVYEDILNPLGPVADCRVVDPVDALGAGNINGKEDVELTFSTPYSGQSSTFKFKMLQNSDLDDRSSSGNMSGHHKQYNFKFVSPELINAQGNYVKKSYNETTSSMVESIVKNNLKSEKQVEIKDSTRGQRRMVFHQEHPVEALKKLNDEHVSAQNESSLYTLFATNDGSNQKYVFSTFEELFKQGPVVTLTQSATLGAGASESEKQDSIIWFKASDSFFTPSRPMDKSNEQTYNLVTGKAYNVSPKPAPQFTYADSEGVYGNFQGSGDDRVPAMKVNDPANNKNTKTYVADAKTKRQAYFSHLTQNAAELEVAGNSSIKLGSVIELNIPGKTDSGNSLGEKQMNGKALVVAIRHKIKPFGETPRYTMVLRVVKASYKEGGGGNG